MCPRKDTRRAGLTLPPYPSGGGRVGFEKARERSAALPRIDVKRPARDVADHRLGREFVALDLGGLARLTGQKRDQRAQHLVQCAGTLRARPRRSECGQPASHR